jgi:hypothetical protein
LARSSFEEVRLSKKLAEVFDDLSSMRERDDVACLGVGLHELTETVRDTGVDTGDSLGIRKDFSEKLVLDSDRFLVSLNRDVVERPSQKDQPSRRLRPRVRTVCNLAASGSVGTLWISICLMLPAWRVT